jgi:hypothetical protein
MEVPTRRDAQEPRATCAGGGKYTQTWDMVPQKSQREFWFIPSKLKIHFLIEMHRYFLGYMPMI